MEHLCSRLRVGTSILLSRIWAGYLRLGWWLQDRWLWFRSTLLPTRRATAQGLVEYALILVLIAIVVIGILTSLGEQTSQVFDEVKCGLEGGEYHSDSGRGNSNRCRN